jgi:two-component system nitrogen regulation response regulator GlnG
MQLLSQFQYPGNVRQLENICHWLTVMAPAQVIDLKDLPPEVLPLQAASVFSEEGASADQLPSSLSDSSAGLTAAVVASSPMVSTDWEAGLEKEALVLLETNRQDVWDVLNKRFEARLILAALSSTRGRRIEAALKLGIGRNTITRKIQELGLED